MKVQVCVNPNLEEMEVVIKAPSYGPEVTVLEQLLLGQAGAASREIAFLIGERDGCDRQLNVEQVLRFFTENKHVCAHCPDGNWKVRLRIKDLKAALNPSRFVAINQGEIVNLRFVKHMDLSLAGTIRLELQDGTSCFVSRRSLGAFKKALHF